MQGSELREMSDDELVAKERELQESLFRFRLRRGMNQLDNAGAMVQARRDLARIKTIRGERARQQREGEQS